MRSAGTAVLAAITLASAGGATGFVLHAPTAPRDLRGAAAVESAPVGSEEFADERTVKITLERSSASPLVVGLAGRVTATACKPGQPLRAGQAVGRIDDTPLIALATAVPLYRSLSPGDEGEDVTALQRELTRLGYKIAPTGTYGRSTRLAVKKLQTVIGVDRPDGAIHVERILWLPAAAVTPDACELVKGMYVSPGQPYAKARADLTRIVVESMPPYAAPGERVMHVMGVTGPIGSDGAATDAAFLSRVAATPENRRAAASEENPELTAVITLKDPLRTLKVPPGALFAVQDDRGCLQSGTKVHSVRIVGSRLGATLVVLKGDAPARVNLGASITARSCG